MCNLQHCYWSDDVHKHFLPNLSMRSLVTVCRVSTSALVLDHISLSLALYSKQSGLVKYGHQNIDSIDTDNLCTENFLLERFFVATNYCINVHCLRYQYHCNRKELLFVTCRSPWRKSWDFPWATSHPRPRWEAQHPTGPLILLPNLNIQILYDALETKVQVHLSRKDCLHEGVSEVFRKNKKRGGGCYHPRW